MEVRAAVRPSKSDEYSVIDAPTVEGRSVQPPRERQRPRRAESGTTASSRGRARITATTRPVPLPRDVEYAYIRGDLIRLLITSAILISLMLILLAVVE